MIRYISLDSNKKYISGLQSTRHYKLGGKMRFIEDMAEKGAMSLWLESSSMDIFSWTFLCQGIADLKDKPWRIWSWLNLRNHNLPKCMKCDSVEFWLYDLGELCGTLVQRICMNFMARICLLEEQKRTLVKFHQLA